MPIRMWNLNLKVRLMGEALFNLLFWMYFPFITVYFGSELGTAAAGLLMTVPPIFGLLGGLVGGALADSWGRRPAMLLGAWLQTAMFAWFAASSNPWGDYMAFIGIGLGGALYRPASLAMVADVVPAAERRLVFATFTTANNIGAVLGPALGAVFFFRHRHELLWSCSIVMALYGIAIYFVVRESLPLSARRSKRSAPLSHVIQEQWQSYSLIFRDKIFLLYVVAGIFALVPIMQLDLYMPVYVIGHVPDQPIFSWIGVPLTLSGTEIFGWLLGFNGLLFVLLILPVTSWFRHWNERNVFILSSLLAGIGNFALGLGTNIWFLFLVTFVFTVGELVRSPVSQSFISRYAPERMRGQYMGADSLQGTIGKFIAPVTVFLSGWIAPMGIFSILLVFACISATLYLLLFRLYREQPSDMAS